jgi:hypothetical protein
MPDNTGFLLLGLGALLFLGRNRPDKPVEEVRRQLGGQSSGGGPGGYPAAPAFNIQSYIDDLFTDTSPDIASVPVQPPISLFFPPRQVVTSSGVPGITTTAPDLVTPTTRVQIGGEGGETIVQSSLDIIRKEQIAKQEFAAAANASIRTAPVGVNYFYQASIDANLAEEQRQRDKADAVMAKNRAAQLALANTRQQQELVVTERAIVAPPTINMTIQDDDEWSIDPFAQSGGSITVSADIPSVEVEDVDFSSEGISGDFSVISGGMDSPTVFAGEEEDTFSLSGVQDYGYGVYYGGAEDE